MQFIQLALQIGHPTFQLGIFTAGGVETFLGNRQFLIQRLAVALAAFIATGLSLAGITSDQLQVVLGLGLCRRSPGGAALGGIQLTIAGAGNAATLAPGRVLLGHLGNRLGRRTAGDLLGIRQTQNLTAFQAIDVATDKRLRIQLLDGQHGLMHGATRHPTGDFPQGIAGGGFVFVAIELGGCGDDRRRASDGRNSRLRSAYRGRQGAWRRSDNRQLRCSRRRGLRRVQRRIEQQGVFAQQTAARPEHFHQEVQVRLAHRLARGHANHALAVGLEHGRELEVREEILAINAGFAELFRGGQARD